MQESTERCVLLRCSKVIFDGQPSVTLPSGGKIHFDCLIDWRLHGGALAPPQQKEATHGK